jgi:hypothetical protein
MGNRNARHSNSRPQSALTFWIFVQSRKLSGAECWGLHDSKLSFFDGVMNLTARGIGEAADLSSPKTKLWVGWRSNHTENKK